MDLKQFVLSWPLKTRQEILQILKEAGSGGEGGSIALIKWDDAFPNRAMYGGAPSYPKIALIKAIRSYTGLDLKSAKDLADRIPVELPVASHMALSAFQEELREIGFVYEMRG